MVNSIVIDSAISSGDTVERRSTAGSILTAVTDVDRNSWPSCILAQISGAVDELKRVVHFSSYAPYLRSYEEVNICVTVPLKEIA